MSKLVWASACCVHLLSRWCSTLSNPNVVLILFVHRTWSQVSGRFPYKFPMICIQVWRTRKQRA